MKTKLQVISTVLTILSAAILLTIYLVWLFYPLEIEWLQLEKVVYMKAEDILYNFQILMNYLTNPFQQVLDMPNFSSSADGLHHFEQVKWLFHFTQLAFLISLPVSLAFFKNVLRKGYGSLFQKTYIWMAVLPLLIGGMGALIGFNAFFTLFHQILFVGDSTWLFNPNTDPVIYILPEVFFLHCFILFFLLYEALIGAVIFYIHRKRKDKGKCLEFREM